MSAFRWCTQRTVDTLSWNGDVSAMLKQGIDALNLAPPDGSVQGRVAPRVDIVNVCTTLHQPRHQIPMIALYRDVYSYGLHGCMQRGLS